MTPVTFQGGLTKAATLVAFIAYIRDKLRLTRTAVLVFTMYLNWDVYQWVMRMVERQIITQEWMTTSILGSVSLLTAAVFKLYADNHPPTDPPPRSTEDA